MALEELNPLRRVRAGGRVYIAHDFDPETGDVAASMWTGRITMAALPCTREELASMPSTDRRVFRKGEYEPEPPDDLEYPAWATRRHPAGA
ncbi:MAG TPA: hypothetical protein VNF47_15355 [Streptosporangiaceae bacterium]|nr:hypothetical protein [Streptosporangiaceae bacterium]